MSEAEFVDLEALARQAPAWAELCAGAEPNPFAEPGFLLPLLAYERPRRLAFALMRDGGRLVGVAVLVLPSVGLARVWMSPYAALPAAVLARDAASAALAALLALLSERTRLVGLLWPQVERGGPLAAAMAALPLLHAGQTQRAALNLAGVAAFEASLDPKRRSKWARAARRLAALGRVEEADAAAAVEAFFAIERGGWKGARGAALADDPRRLVFARAALAAFEDAGRLDALSLTLDGKPIAAGLVLKAGARAYYWKTAYDEAYAAYSPGVQLTLAHSRRLAARLELALVDSCAAPDHPMIGRVWSDALAFDDWAIGLRAQSGRPLAIWLALTQAKAAARERVKRWVNRALRRKSS